MIPPETVVFAIRAALTLYGAARTAYVDGARGRPLVLPLPRTPGIGFDSAHTWFTFDEIGKKVAAGSPRVKKLLAVDRPIPEQQAELLQLYLVLYAEHAPLDSPLAEVRGHYSSDQLVALMEIRQWADGEFGQPPTALQQIGGTIVNLAVDYFANTPGAVSDERPEGKALLAFLRGIDHVDFANTAVTDIAGDLFIAVLDCVAATPIVLGGGKKEQLFVESVTTTLAASAAKHLRDAPTTERWDAAEWLQLLARALVQGGAETVLANPVLFLNAKDGPGGTLVARVGETVAGLLIGDDRPVFQRLLSADGMTKVVQAALDTVAKNPDLVKVDQPGLRNVLVAMAKDLAQLPAPLTPDLFPEMVRLLFEKSADNMDLVWGKNFTSADTHLLVTASRALLKALGRDPGPGASWRPALTKDQILGVTETVFSEVLENPDWLLTRAGGSDATIGVAVTAMLESLRRVDGRRLSAEAGVSMIRAGLQAGAGRLALFDRLPPGGADAGKIAVTAALDAILSQALGGGADAGTRWRLARSSVLQGLVATGLQTLARTGADQKHLDVLRVVVAGLTAAAGPVDLAGFAVELERRLRAA